jgi:hypothetical protein
MGAFFDDDDFLLKIISKKIEIKCISNESTNVGGIHLFHQHADEGYCQHKLSNEDLFSHKKRIYEKTGQYIDYNKLYKLYKNIK